MPGINTLGSVTPPAVFLNTEMHKLHVGFSASGVIHKGQPCKLAADGTVLALAAAGTDRRELFVGVSIHEAAIGDKITLMMRAFVVLQVISSAASAVGPVKHTGYDATNLRPQVATGVPGTDDIYGHGLNAAGGAGTIVTVAVLP